jgi:cytochrome c556
MKKAKLTTRTIMVIAFVSLTAMSCKDSKKEQTNAQDEQITGSDELLPIMYQLMADMNQINEGIFIENYPMIDSAAYRIANHLEINTKQMQIIKKNLGEDVQEFVRIDMVVHDRATSIGKAAQQMKMAEILSQYEILQQSCVNCHNQFRSRLRNKLR